MGEILEFCLPQDISQKTKNILVNAGLLIVLYNVPSMICESEDINSSYSFTGKLCYHGQDT